MNKAQTQMKKPMTSELVIGFTNKYYTLWRVSEPYKEWVSEWEYVVKRDYTYIQNLSFDLDKAKAKVEGDCRVDLGLRGTSSFTTSSKKVNTMPDTMFKFGRYCGRKITEIDNIDYISWYYDQTDNEHAKAVLLKNGYKEYRGQVLSEESYQRVRENERLANLARGHHFENKDRVELEIREVGSGGFDGHYGYTYIVTYESKCGKIFKYMGKSPIQLSPEGFTKVKATIKHDSYKDRDETKLQRISIMEVK